MSSSNRTQPAANRSVRGSDMRAAARVPCSSVFRRSYGGGQRRIRRCARQPRGCRRAETSRLAIPKSRTFSLPAASHEIGRLDVPVDDALNMRLCERVEQLQRQFDGPIHRHRPAREQEGQRRALDEFLRDIELRRVTGGEPGLSGS